MGTIRREEFLNIYKEESGEGLAAGAADNVPDLSNGIRIRPDEPLERMPGASGEPKKALIQELDASQSAAAVK